MLFPLRCVHCGREGTRLCPSCTAALEQPGPETCRRCGKPSLYEVPGCGECNGRRLHFVAAAAAFAYEGPARSLVRRLKYSGQYNLAVLMADLSCSRADLTDLGKGATLTCVPLHRTSQFRRGYNQAGLYARALAERLGLPYQELLRKRHPTPPQNQLNNLDRRNNLRDSIALRKGAMRKGARAGSRLLLVDDVYTTGSTASECARVLKRGLEAEVFVWTFARTVKR